MNLCQIMLDCFELNQILLNYINLYLPLEFLLVLLGPGLRQSLPPRLQSLPPRLQITATALAFTP